MTTDRPTRLFLRAAVGFAGGRLHTLNRVLWLLHQCRLRNCPGLLWLDSGASSTKDQGTGILDFHGQVLSLPGTDPGGASAEERSAWIAMAGDRLPGSHDLEAVLESYVPAVGESWADACARLWTLWLDGSSTQPIEVLVATNAPNAPGDLEVDTAAMPSLLWLGGRALRAMKELGVTPAEALLDEDSLKDRVRQKNGRSSRRAAAALEESFNEHLATLRSTLLAEDPGLIGSWSRLRRAGRKALSDHRRALDRYFRNRRSIRGRRVRALVQSLHPGGGKQGERLGLLYARLALGLNPAEAVEHFEVFHDTASQDIVLVNAESGNPLWQSLC